MVTLQTGSGQTAAGLIEIILRLGITETDEAGAFPAGGKGLSRHTGNAALQPVGETADSDAKAAVRIRVSNSADAKREQFKVGWLRSDGNGFLGAPTDIYVPPGQSRIVSLPPPPLRLSSPVPPSTRSRPLPPSI